LRWLKFIRDRFRPKKRASISKAQQLAKQRPEVGKMLDVLTALVKEHDVCCWRIGNLFNQVQDKFQNAEGKELSDRDLEIEATSMQNQMLRESSLCHQIGLKYNELHQLIGRKIAEQLIEEHPRISGTDVVLYGKVAERFNESQTVTYGIHKIGGLVKYAELNGITLGNGDPGASEISLLQGDGRWKKCAFRDCSADDLQQTVLAIKVQKGIPLDDELDYLDSD
jgi:hypothetical protein